MKFVICPHCGAHLDHGEKCDCMNDPEEVKAHEREIRIEQLRIDLAVAHAQDDLRLQSMRRLKLENVRGNMLRGITETEKTA